MSESVSKKGETENLTNEAALFNVEVLFRKVN